MANAVAPTIWTGIRQKDPIELPLEYQNRTPTRNAEMITPTTRAGGEPNPRVAQIVARVIEVKQRMSRPINARVCMISNEGLYSPRTVRADRPTANKIAAMVTRMSK